MSTVDHPITLVLGASEVSSRYSNMAVKLFRLHDYSVIAYGKRQGRIEDVDIHTQWNPSWQVDNVTLYINPQIQKEYYQSILDLKPSKVIFNPGTENPEFDKLLRDAGIQTEQACTLVMLRTGIYD